MRATVIGLLVFGACNASDSDARLDASSHAPDAPLADAAALFDAAADDAMPPLDGGPLPDAMPLPDAAMVDAPPPDAPPPPAPPWTPPQPLPAGMCAPALGDVWTGTAGDDFKGCASCTISHDATISWQRVSTTDCVDRYVPSGTVRKAVSYACLYGTGPIAATDGELLIDRSTVPPTYTMQGTTQLTATEGCEDPQPTRTSVTWARFRGEVAGDAFGGGGRWSSTDVGWRFTRSDATPPAPAPCVEPPVDVWVGTASQSRLSAELTWIRTTTTGCVDHFVPTGIVTHTPGPTPSCTEQITTPDHGPISPTDGWLTIDRSQWPLRFTMGGETHWTGETRCTRPDGTISTTPTPAATGPSATPPSTPAPASPAPSSTPPTPAPGPPPRSPDATPPPAVPDLEDASRRSLARRRAPETHGIALPAKRGPNPRSARRRGRDDSRVVGQGCYGVTDSRRP